MTRIINCDTVLCSIRCQQKLVHKLMDHPAVGQIRIVVSFCLLASCNRSVCLFMVNCSKVFARPNSLSCSSSLVYCLDSLQGPAWQLLLNKVGLDCCYELCLVQFIKGGWALVGTSFNELDFCNASSHYKCSSYEQSNPTVSQGAAGPLL